MKYLKINLILISIIAISLFNCSKEKNEIIAPIKGYLSFITGSVNLIDIRGKKIPAKIGDEISQGMKVETIGDKSFADIYIGDNSIKILGNTIMEVQKLYEKLKSKNTESIFIVEQGKLFSKVGKKLAKGDLYEVKTPTATAGVRGTEFLVEEENGKANIACLTGLVEVLNNSETNKEPVVLQQNEETDVLPGQDMIKKQISADRLRMLNIVRNIKEINAEIRQKFEQQREEIRKHVTDQKEKNETMIEEQKAKDKQSVEEQKQKDQSMIKNITDTTKEAGAESANKAKEQMNSTKVDTNEAKAKAEEHKESVKPVIDKDKFKVNKDQYKQNK